MHNVISHSWIAPFVVQLLQTFYGVLEVGNVRMHWSVVLTDFWQLFPSVSVNPTAHLVHMAPTSRMLLQQSAYFCVLYADRSYGILGVDDLTPTGNLF